MKKSNIFYTLSLILFAICFYLLIEGNLSQRMQLITGFLTVLSFGTNVVGYALKK